MKKVILAMMLSAAALMADGVVLGGNLGFGKVDTDLYGFSGGNSYSDSVKEDVVNATLKAGYASGDTRIMAYVGHDNFSGQPENAIAYGLMLDKTFGSILIGVNLGFGKQEFNGTDKSFREYGIRTAYIVQASDNKSVEIGVNYKKQDFGEVTGVDPITGYTTDSLNIDSYIVGVYIGINFNL